MKRLILYVSFLSSLTAQVPAERILKASTEPESWLTYSGDYQSRRYSTLSEIDRSNVNRLKVLWMYQIKAHHKFEATPLVFDGIMYITEPPSDVTAIDLRSGRPVWSFRRPVPPVPVCCG